MRCHNFLPFTILVLFANNSGAYGTLEILSATSEVVVQQQTITVILMPWGRVGSNLCVDILLQSRQIILYNEPLTAIETNSGAAEVSLIAAEQMRWLEENVVTPQNGRKLVIKLAAKSIACPSDVIAFLKRRDTTLIIMDRRDVLATAVSALRAAEYAQQTFAETGTASWALEKGKEARVKPQVSYADLCESVDHIIESRKICQQFSQAIPVGAWIWYEELIADFENEVKRVVEAVGLEPFAYKVRHEKFTPMPLAESISNPDVLKKVAMEYGLALPD